MNNNEVERITAIAEQACIDAGKEVRRIARVYNTSIVIERNGKTVLLNPYTGKDCTSEEMALQTKSVK